jgi:hypothetical protein
MEAKSTDNIAQPSSDNIYSMELDKSVSNKISFVAFIIPAFAEAYKMEIKDALYYLKDYGGLDFILENWWALHTDNVLYALNDIYTICYQNGGIR